LPHSGSWRPITPAVGLGGIRRDKAVTMASSTFYRYRNGRIDLFIYKDNGVNNEQIQFNIANPTAESAFKTALMEHYDKRGNDNGL
jgi:hypothetical protein